MPEDSDRLLWNDTQVYSAGAKKHIGFYRILRSLIRELVTFIYLSGIFEAEYIVEIVFA